MATRVASDQNPAPDSTPASTKRPRRARLDQEASKVVTRAGLLQAAGELFRDKGIDAPSLDAICERAGYTRGAFYVHFEDRAAIVQAVCVEYQAELLKQVGEYDDSPEALPNLVERLIRLDTTVPFHLLLHAAGRSPELAAKLSASLEEAAEIARDATRYSQALATVRGDVDAAQVGWAVVALGIGIQALRESGAAVGDQLVAALLNQLLKR